MIDPRLIDGCLPQTQCRRCGFDDCRAYADAISRGDAEINRCPPGGDATLDALAQLLKLPRPDLAQDLEPWPGLQLARIREAECIGCTKCIAVCPVDAIVGSGKRMHSVLEADCTGCRLCLPPCPVDCIDMVPVARVPMAGQDGFDAAASDRFRRLRARNRYRLRAAETAPIPGEDADAEAIRADIARAVASARTRRQA